MSHKGDIFDAPRYPWRWVGMTDRPCRSMKTKERRTFVLKKALHRSSRWSQMAPVVRSVLLGRLPSRVGLQGLGAADPTWQAQRHSWAFLMWDFDHRYLARLERRYRKRIYMVAQVES